MLGKYSNILSAGDAEWAYFSRFDITKQRRTSESGTKYMSMYVIYYDQ